MPSLRQLNNKQSLLIVQTINICQPWFIQGEILFIYEQEYAINIIDILVPDNHNT